MSQFSEIIGSFERKGSFPLEAYYIFATPAELEAFYAQNEYALTMHKGLLKVVEDNGDGHQALYWVTPGSSGLEFTELLTLTDDGNINDALKALEDKLNQEIQDRIIADNELRGTDDVNNLPSDLQNMLDLANAIEALRTASNDTNAALNTLRDQLKATVGTNNNDIISYLQTLDYKSLTEVVNALKNFMADIMGSPLPTTDFSTLRGIEDFVRAMKADIINLQVELNNTQMGVGLDQSGNFTPDALTTYLHEAISVMHCLRILDSLIANVYGKSSIVEDAYYDSANEELVIIFIMADGSTDEVRIPVEDFVNEFEVDNTDPTKVVELEIERIPGDRNLISGDVRISTQAYNLLSKVGNALYASGHTSAMYHTFTPPYPTAPVPDNSTGSLNTVIDTLLKGEFADIDWDLIIELGICIVSETLAQYVQDAGIPSYVDNIPVITSIDFNVFTEPILKTKTILVLEDGAINTYGGPEFGTDAISNCAVIGVGGIRNLINTAGFGLEASNVSFSNIRFYVPSGGDYTEKTFILSGPRNYFNNCVFDFPSGNNTVFPTFSMRGGLATFNNCRFYDQINFEGNYVYLNSCYGTITGTTAQVNTSGTLFATGCNSLIFNHTDGLLSIDNCRLYGLASATTSRTTVITSTATASSTNRLIVTNSDSRSYYGYRGIVNKTGSCDYAFDNFIYYEEGSTVNGTHLDQAYIGKEAYREHEVYMATSYDGKNGPSDGSMYAPFTTVAAALDYMDNDPGSTYAIKFFPGTYTEDWTIDANDYNLLFEGIGVKGQWETEFTGNFTITGTQRVRMNEMQINGALTVTGSRLCYFESCSFGSRVNVNGASHTGTAYNYHYFKDCFFNNGIIVADSNAVELELCRQEAGGTVFWSTATNLSGALPPILIAKDCIGFFVSHQAGYFFLRGDNHLSTDSSGYSVSSTASGTSALLALESGTTWQEATLTAGYINKTGNCPYVIGSTFTYEPSAVTNTLTGTRVEGFNIHSNQIYDHKTRTGYTPVDATLEGHLDGISEIIENIAENLDGVFLPLTGGTLTGPLRLFNANSPIHELSIGQTAGGSSALKLFTNSTAPDGYITTEGDLNLNSSAIMYLTAEDIYLGTSGKANYNGNEIATVNNLNDYLPLTGGTLSGDLILEERLNFTADGTDGSIFVDTGDNTLTIQVPDVSGTNNGDFNILTGSGKAMINGVEIATQNDILPADNIVTITGDQTIIGTKTFNNSIYTDLGLFTGGKTIVNDGVGGVAITNAGILGFTGTSGVNPTINFYNFGSTAVNASIGLNSLGNLAVQGALVPAISTGLLGTVANPWGTVNTNLLNTTGNATIGANVLVGTAIFTGGKQATNDGLSGAHIDSNGIIRLQGDVNTSPQLQFYRNGSTSSDARFGYNLESNSIFISSTLQPLSSNSGLIDLGAPNYEWRDLYVNNVLASTGMTINNVNVATVNDIPDLTNIETELEDLRNELNEQGHFRGAYDTSAEISSIADPHQGDYAYSLESGTVWTYDSVTSTWSDSGQALPSGVYSFSDANPLMDGSAAPGVATTMSRSDHRHPVDTSRASVASLANYLALTGNTGTTPITGNVFLSNGSFLNLVNTTTGNIGLYYDTANPSLTITSSATQGININTTSAAGTATVKINGVKVATVDDLANIDISGYLPLTGGTMTGSILASGNNLSLGNSSNRWALWSTSISNSGSLTVSGDSYLNAISAGGNITPTTNNAYSLGASTLRWSNIWGQAANIVSISSTGTSTLGTVSATSLTPTVNGGLLGGTTLRWQGYFTTINTTGAATLTSATLSGALTVNGTVATLPQNTTVGGNNVVTTDDALAYVIRTSSTPPTSSTASNIITFVV